MSAVAGIVLAAGTSSRFGEGNKLLAIWQGRPMVRTVVESALKAKLNPVIVVTGHEAEAVEAALTGLDVQFVHNPDFAGGQAGSLIVGIAAVPRSCDGAMILLGDMPMVGIAEIGELQGAFVSPDAIVVPHHEGKRGNPVIIGRAHFDRLRLLKGDKGARELLQGEDVIMVDVASDAVLKDIDTPESLS